MTIFPTRILFASDGSEDSELAATTVVGLANITGSELHVLHVAPHRHGSSAHSGDTRSLLLGGRPVARVTDRDIRPDLRQPPSYGSSNPAARSRYQSYTPAKIHSPSLSSQFKAGNLISS